MSRATPAEYLERVRLDAYEAVVDGDPARAHDLMVKLEAAARELGRSEAKQRKPTTRQAAGIARNLRRRARQEAEG